LVGMRGAEEGYAALEALFADVAPGADGVGDDLDVDCCGHCRCGGRVVAEVLTKRFISYKEVKDRGVGFCELIYLEEVGGYDYKSENTREAAMGIVTTPRIGILCQTCFSQFPSERCNLSMNVMRTTMEA